MGTKARWTLLIALFAVALAIAPVAIGQETEGRPDGRPDDTETPTAPIAEGQVATTVPTGSDQDQIPGLIQPLDQVILDDLIVDGSACIGLDCVNGESFGFDTIRLKENNLRIKFQDTSSSASFPTNDWQITVNDSSNGGQNKFSIDDIDGGRTPFTIEASAPSHSLYVDDGGRVGFGTSVPVADLHAKTGNTPTLRLEQDNTSGFTAQTWDVAGNEANFFIRDVTNGSTLPIRIRPGAPSSSLDIAGDGDVGFGTSSPEAPIDVNITSGRTVGVGNAIMLLRRAGGPLALQLEDQDSGEYWNLTMADTASQMRFSRSGTGAQEMILDSSGNLTITGSLTACSGGAVCSPQSTFPDYVFAPRYGLMSLGELAEYIRVNGHLPGVMSAADVEAAGGINMTELQLQLLEKIEELTLYTLQQEERIAQLEALLAGS